MKTLANPAFFLAANAALWGYSPNLSVVREAADVARQQYNIKPASGDQQKILLVVIDAQKDFCHKEGTLYVAGRSGTGAIDDNVRLSEFIYRNLNSITRIAPTLDTHYPFQIFSPSFWETSDGGPVVAHTIISADEVASGKYRPTMRALAAIPALKGNMAFLTKQCIHYCRELEKAGKYQLYVWPEHCLIGGDGHSLVGVIQEARMFHAYCRGAQNNPEIKGGNPLTENYSVFAPEVLTLFNGGALDQRNHALVQSFLEFDRIIFAGQAASHCVAASIGDFLSDIAAKDPKLAEKAYLMKDCMSAVTVPDGKGGFILDFTPQAESALDRFQTAGMHIVESTTPIQDWPDFM